MRCRRGFCIHQTHHMLLQYSSDPSGALLGQAGMMLCTEGQWSVNLQCWGRCWGLQDSRILQGRHMMYCDTAKEKSTHHQRSMRKSEIALRKLP